MDTNLTRRTLLKITTLHTGALLFGGVSSVSAAAIIPDSGTLACHKCNAVNKSTTVSSLPANHTTYCHNCGVDLISFNYDKSLEPLKASVLDENDCSSHSRYIPFPNHEYLVNCKKPKLQLGKLLFWCWGLEVLANSIVIRYAWPLTCFATSGTSPWRY